MDAHNAASWEVVKRNGVEKASSKHTPTKGGRRKLIGKRKKRPNGTASGSTGSGGGREDPGHRRKAKKLTEEVIDIDGHSDREEEEEEEREKEELLTDTEEVRAFIDAKMKKLAEEAEAHSAKRMEECKAAIESHVERIMIDGTEADLKRFLDAEMEKSKRGFDAWYVQRRAEIKTAALEKLRKERERAALEREKQKRSATVIDLDVEFIQKVVEFFMGFSFVGLTSGTVNLSFSQSTGIIVRWGFSDGSGLRAYPVGQGQWALDVRPSTNDASLGAIVYTLRVQCTDIISDAQANIKKTIDFAVSGLYSMRSKAADCMRASKGRILRLMLASCVLTEDYFSFCGKPQRFSEIGARKPQDVHLWNRALAKRITKATGHEDNLSPWFLDKLLYFCPNRIMQAYMHDLVIERELRSSNKSAKHFDSAILYGARELVEEHFTQCGEAITQGVQDAYQHYLSTKE